MSATVHLCGICDSVLEWKLNEAVDDFDWWCPGCGDWCEDVVKVRVPDRDGIAYEKARSRGWED